MDTILTGPTRYRELITLPRLTPRTGKVTIKTLSSRRHVQIDGLALTRS